MDYKRILIVDDSATSRMIIKRCFQMAGYMESSYFEEEDGLKAFSFLQENEVDLILTDINMPRMDGKNFIKKLRIDDRTKDIPIIVISSMGNDELDRKLSKEQVMGIIRKPMSPAKVVDVIGEVI